MALAAMALCSSCTSVERHELTTRVLTPRPGTRVYDSRGNFLGTSPVTLRGQAEARHLEGGLVRWFVEGEEVAPGGSWPLKLFVYSGGVRKDVLIQVPFDPLKPFQDVEARP